jgi:hypothetical protein
MISTPSSAPSMLYRNSAICCKCSGHTSSRSGGNIPSRVIVPGGHADRSPCAEDGSACILKMEEANSEFGIWHLGYWERVMFCIHPNIREGYLSHRSSIALLPQKSHMALALVPVFDKTPWSRTADTRSSTSFWLSAGQS